MAVFKGVDYANAHMNAHQLMNRWHSSGGWEKQAESLIFLHVALCKNKYKRKNKKTFMHKAHYL